MPFLRCHACHALNFFATLSGSGGSTAAVCSSFSKRRSFTVRRPFLSRLRTCARHGRQHVEVSFWSHFCVPGFF